MIRKLAEFALGVAMAFVLGSFVYAKAYRQGQLDAYQVVIDENKKIIDSIEGAQSCMKPEKDI